MQKPYFELVAIVNFQIAFMHIRFWVSQCIYSVNAVRTADSGYVRMWYICPMWGCGVGFCKSYCGYHSYGASSSNQLFKCAPQMICMHAFLCLFYGDALPCKA